MQISQTHSKGLKREFTVTVAAKDFDTYIFERLQTLSKKVKLPGFRPGKAPQHILMQRFGDQATEEALEKVINNGIQQVLKDFSLRQAHRPKVDVVSYGQGKDLEYKIDIEVLPEVEIQDFQSINLEKLKVQLEEQEIDDKLNELARDHKKFNDLKKPRAAKKGDSLHLDLTVTIDGKLRKDFNKQIKIELGSSDQLIFEKLEDQLIGAKIGDELTVDDKIINDIDDASLAGKEALLHVVVKNIQEPQAFNVDDEFAKEMGTDDLGQLRERVKDSMQGEYDKLARLRLKRHLLDALAEKYTFELPDSMVDNEFNAIWKRLQEELKTAKESGQNTDVDSKDEEDLKAEYRQIAERRVRLGLLISEIARLNKIQTTEEEIRRAIFSEAMRFPQHMQQVIDFYRKNPGAVEQLAAPILEDKVVDFILESVSLKEKSVSVPELLTLIKGVVPGFEEDEEANKSQKKQSGTEKKSKTKGKVA